MKASVLSSKSFTARALALLAIASVVALFGAVPANAARAGIVVDFGNGNVVTKCVHFHGPQTTGFDLLQASGLEFTFQNFGPSLGNAICSIEDLGCQFPAQACFCQCTGTGPCSFMAYFVLQNGAFVLSNVGESTRVVHNKDVDGYIFNDGSTPPPVFTIHQICSGEEDD
jgi:hypothetical protein